MFPPPLKTCISFLTAVLFPFASSFGCIVKIHLWSAHDPITCIRIKILSVFSCIIQNFRRFPLFFLFFFSLFSIILSLSLALSEHACPSFFKVAAKYRNPLNNSLRKQSTCRMERGIEAYRSHECDVYAPLFIFASFPFFYRLLYDSKTIVLIVPR